MIGQCRNDDNSVNEGTFDWTDAGLAYRLLLIANVNGQSHTAIQRLGLIRAN